MRRAFALVLAAALALTAGCGTDPTPSREGLWHDGRLFMATGNSTGVYYQLGGGYADLVTRHLDGYELRAEPTGASGENIQRVANGDMDIALTLADTAADAFAGKGAFDGRPQKIVALSRVYRNYAHLVVRTAANINKFTDLKGKRISTGSPGSGTDVVAGRILQAGGIEPDREITRLRLSLPDTAKGMQNGSIDALFFAGGLPTPGITDLLASAPGQYRILPLADVLEPLTQRYGAVYGVAKLAKATYGTPADVETIVISNLIVVSPDMPEQLAKDLTRILFDYQTDLSRVHPEGGNFDKESGPKTDPVPLHPGAKAYFEGR